VLCCAAASLLHHQFHYITRCDVGVDVENYVRESKNIFNLIHKQLCVSAAQQNYVALGFMIHSFDCVGVSLFVLSEREFSLFSLVVVKLNG
jgi:hypothetical protein